MKELLGMGLEVPLAGDCWSTFKVSNVQGLTQAQ
jgi:hypothetical protein